MSCVSSQEYQRLNIAGHLQSLLLFTINYLHLQCLKKLSLLDVNSKMRKDIEDKTRLCDNRRLALIAIVKEGPSYKDLIYEEDN